MNSAVGSSSSSSSSNNTNPVVGSLNSSSNNSNTANKLLAQQIVELLRRLNIRLVAFDFDYTIVTIHTGGQWLDSPEKLAEFVRPCFRDLLPVLLKTPDLNVCVVTYSPQERLIREVLRISLKDEHDVYEKHGFNVIFTLFFYYVTNYIDILSYDPNCIDQSETFISIEK